MIVPIVNYMSLLVGVSPLSKYVWNQRFESWGGPLSDTEDQKCQNAESVIKSAIDADSQLASMNLKVFAQGSYKANTNIKADSDVDICVCHKDVFFAEYPEGKDQSHFGNSGSGLTFSDYRGHIGRALHNRFTYLGVSAGDKSFKIKENTYRIKADVVPAFEYRRYYIKEDGTQDYTSGVRFITTDGATITNYPDQAHRNGVAKNKRTGFKYKQVVRILKRLRSEMQENNIAEASDIPSFLIESMVWNVADSYFEGDSLHDIVAAVLLEAWYRTKEDNRCDQWCEVNDIKYLFRPRQPWSRAKANDFLWAAKSHIGA